LLQKIDLEIRDKKRIKNSTENHISSMCSDQGEDSDMSINDFILGEQLPSVKSHMAHMGLIGVT
jgi:hypothetical protein